MSGGQALPQQQQHQPFLNSPGSQLAHLFGFPNSTNGPSHHHHHNHNHQQQRIKLKRSRQRVDAGEPRNSYQGSMSRPSLQPRLLATGTGQLFGQSAPPPFPSDPTGLNGLLPHVQNAWLRLQKQQQQQQDNGAELERDTNELIKDDEEDEMTEMDRTPEDGGEPEEEALDLATVASPLDENGIVGEQPERTLEEVQQSPKSSKRKSFQPMRQIEQRQQMTNGDDHEEVDRTKGDEPEELKDDPMLNGSEDIEDKIVTVPTMANHQPPTLPETSSSSFAPGNNKFHELFSTLQQKLNLDYMKTNGIGPSVNNPRPLQISQPPPQLPQSVINKDYSKLVHTLKQEIIACLSGSIDKVVGEFAQAEAAAAAAAAMAAARAAAVVQHQQHQQQMEQQQQQQHRPPFFLHPLYHPYAGNPAAAAALFSASGQSSGIFPAAGFPFAGNSSVATLAANAAAAMRKVDDYSPLAPRKKRSKVTDTRLSKLPMAPRDDNSPRTPSNRDSPQLSGYFPPTMVGHPLYGSSSTFGNDTRDDSPINSDDLSDYGPCDGSMLQSSTHLRKAKLMFFYTRYPNSSLLKSYFPDIHFNKNNTAQLVKWFSNFREFFYIQMEKHARSALADQVRSRDEIVVTTDSDIYKQLNQHYNRNNHIQPPERLCHVIQETLREFFSAIQVGRDAEPSWKKSIYKVISRLDDPIPDYFKDPHFLERLEKP